MLPQKLFQSSKFQLRSKNIRTNFKVVKKIKLQKALDNLISLAVRLKRFMSYFIIFTGNY